MAIGGKVFGAKSSVPKPTINARSQKDWRSDPEWIKIKYGDWGGPGVSDEPGPMDGILLKDYAPRSSLVVQETFVPKARYPVIDSHIHVVGRSDEEVADWVRTMDEVGVETSIVLTGAIGSEFDALADSLIKAYPGRFLLYCGMDRTDIESPDYSKRVVAELVRCHRMGACGVGEITDKGYGITRDTDLSSEKRLHADDPRLDAFWEKCAELTMPVNLHVADHPSSRTPLDVYQERSPDFQHFNLFGKDIPSFDELIDKRNRTLEKHPETVFIACHLGNQGHDLGKLSQAMDRYPNLYLDTSARDYELGRTPRASAAFLKKYQNRILFGTDMGRQKSMYQIHWRLLETADEYIVGRAGWRYYGLELPATVLESLYRNTARKVFNI